MISLNSEEYEAEFTMLKNIMSLFMIDLKDLDRNIIMLTKWSEGGLTVEKADKLPFWRYEQFVTIANEQMEEEKKERERQESEQKKTSNVGNFNASNALNKMSNMANKFKK